MIPSTYYLNCPGAQVTRAERELIKEYATQYPPSSTFANIGIMWGCTVHCLHAGNPHATIYALDIKYAWKIQYRDMLDVTWLTGDSRTFQWTNGPIDLLLIDGDHHYETVRSDIANWTPHVPVGGTVLFHDYNPTAHNMSQFPELEGVKRAVNEWQESELGTHRNWKALPVVDSVASFRRLS